MSSKSKYNQEQDTSVRKTREAALDAVKQTIARPSPSALVYGYLKEKDVNLKDMTPEQWKEIEKDLVEILLAEIYPGEDITEDQLNFTSMIQSFGFMSNFIERLEMARMKMAGDSGEETTGEPPKAESGKTFEV